MIISIMKDRQYPYNHYRGCGIPSRQQRRIRICRCMINGMKIILALLLALMIAILFLLTGCTRAVITETPTEGKVMIRPDMSVYKLPAMRYYFYNTDNTGTAQIFTGDDEGNFEGSLPVGIYQVIAGNAEVTGAVYRDMNNHETAAVYAMDVTAYPMTKHQPIRNTSVLDKIYTVVLKDMEVTADENILLTPRPSLLTRTLILSFKLDSRLQNRVTGLTGALYGVYPSVHLFSGLTNEEDIKQSPELAVEYMATPNNDNTSLWQASINLFGLADPEYGNNYQNQMTVSLTLPEETIRIGVDLTHTLSKIMELFGGILPVNIPLEIDIELEWNGIEVIGTVQPWEYGGTGEWE